MKLRERDYNPWRYQGGEGILAVSYIVWWGIIITLFVYGYFIR